MSFSHYLQQQGYASGSISRYGQSVAEFLKWLVQWNKVGSEVMYIDLLHYLEKLSKRGLGRKSLQHHLISLRHYYSYLIKAGMATHNPALRLNVKQQKLLPHGLLEQKELEELYAAYPGEMQNKVILGLMSFQAVRTAELKSLKPLHVQQRDGLLCIPSSGRSKGRTIPLAFPQLLELHLLLEQRKSEEYLLEGLQSGSRNLSLRLHKLYKELRALNIRVRSGDQLRQSCIACWLKTEDLRLVQQKAGHRFISSTERYEQTNTDMLLEQLKFFHPR